MKFGVSTMLFGDGITATQLAVALEERGFDCLFAGEHTHFPVGSSTDLDQFRQPDPLVTLAAAAAVTERLEVGTAVALVAQRDPITLAKEVASLDELSGGRFLFGVGAGWNRAEVADHGVDPTTRVAVMREHVLAMRELWTREVAEFHGTYVDFGPVSSWPKPRQDPHPPVLIGGGFEAAVPKILEYGDGWLALGLTDPVVLTGQIRELSVRAADAGRPAPKVTATATPADARVLGILADAGVERVAVDLPRADRNGSLRTLDTFAKLRANFAES